MLRILLIPGCVDILEPVAIQNLLAFRGLLLLNYGIRLEPPVFSDTILLAQGDDGANDSSRYFMGRVFDTHCNLLLRHVLIQLLVIPPELFLRVIL